MLLRKNNDLKILCLAFFLSFFDSIYASAEGEFSANTLNVSDLGEGNLNLSCSVSELMAKRAEMVEGSGSSEFESMLSFGQQEKRKNHYSIMSSSKIRDFFKEGSESAVFITGNSRKVTIVEFKKSANFNVFSKAVSVCNNLGDGSCIPAIYYDGKKEFCLLFSESDLLK